MTEENNNNVPTINQDELESALKLAHATEGMEGVMVALKEIFNKEFNDLDPEIKKIVESLEPAKV